MVFLVLTRVVDLFYLFLMVLQRVALRLHVRSMVHMEVVVGVGVAWEMVVRIHVVVGRRVRVVGIVVVVLWVHVVFVGLEHRAMVTVMVLVWCPVDVVIMLLLHKIFLRAGLDYLVRVEREFAV